MSAHRHSPSGAFRDQDGQLVTGSHPREQWDDRCPRGWEGFNLRAAWREGIPIDLGGSAGHAYRFHVASGMILVSEWAIIQTAWWIGNATQEQRRIVRELLRERDL